MSHLFIIRYIVNASGNDPIISTTGKASRELFEIRMANNQSHKSDFLIVGSMGYSSSIALGVAVNKPDVRIWCIDGDGVTLMHMAPWLSSVLSSQLIIYMMVENAKANGGNVYQDLKLLLEKQLNCQMLDEELGRFAPWNPEVKTRLDSRGTEEFQIVKL